MQTLPVSTASAVQTPECQPLDLSTKARGSAHSDDPVSIAPKASLFSQWLLKLAEAAEQLDMDIWNSIGRPTEPFPPTGIKDRVVSWVKYRKTADGKFECPWKGCKKTLTRADGVTIHMRQHTGERPYKCLYCEKVFADSSNRTKHMRVHRFDSAPPTFFQ